MSERHANISVFVPHIGCPNKCSFCNQRYITGVISEPCADDVRRAVSVAQGSKNYSPEDTEIAFFGGSFTAIEREYMLELLKAGFEFVKSRTVSGIRISTRPDAIDSEILTVLKQYGVTSIELGAQSLDDTVLKNNNRGHTVRDVYNASALIKEYGFSLGLQVMTGLYTDTPEKAVKTAEKVIEISPDTVRIYPTVLLKNTDLEVLYNEGKYKPQSLEESVELASKLYTMFTENGIKVIRLGLHSIEESAYIDGPWHPAFSELCLSRIMLQRFYAKLKSKGNYTIYVAPNDLSKAIGQKKENIIHLANNGFNCKIKPDIKLKSNQFLIEKDV